MAHPAGPSFGIMTAPQQVSYSDLLRVWQEADAVPALEHAWLFDHLLPIAGDRDGPIFEAWTLLAALAALTSRLRLGVMVTSNRIRPPAVLAKIAATVDVVSGGRLDFGIGAGSRPSVPTARREYDAHGLPYDDFAHSVGALAEAVTVIRRLWTEDQPFDFDGSYLHLAGAFCNPKPVQRPHPPILIAGRSALLDRYCAEVGRDPASITRSIVVPVSYDQPETTRSTIQAAIDAGFGHLVLALSAPYPADAARWVADEFIAPA
jgi:alkanesulfonate monooxygenase SsuD/methylene tetrahydromethanopterin reductase-like flavin-dependent oxidoreductase (luciferase family)